VESRLTSTLGEHAAFSPDDLLAKLLSRGPSVIYEYGERQSEAGPHVSAIPIHVKKFLQAYDPASVSFSQLALRSRFRISLLILSQSTAAK
jgi:hypothetical protein